MKYFFSIFFFSLLVAQNPANGQPNIYQLVHGKNNTPPILDEYRLKDINLSCVLPSGVPVGIILSKDDANLTFFAVKLSLGAVIIANEHEIKRESTSYAVYSFYRECAIHVMGKVKARDLDDIDSYTVSLLHAAECLAVAPTLRALSKEKQISLSQISYRLRQEYGDRIGSSPAFLEGCRNLKVAEEIAVTEMRKH